MAFGGTPVIELVTAGLVRITGVTLAASAAGTIGQFGNGVTDLETPAGFVASNYGAVNLADALQVVAQRSKDTVGVTTIPVVVGKVQGATPDAFTITVVNLDAALATSELEIYVRFH